MLNLNQPLVDRLGKIAEEYIAVTKKKGGEEVVVREMQPVTMKKAIIDSLLSVSPSDNNLTLASKLNRYNLFKKIKDVDSIELTDEEKQLILEKASLRYDIVFVGQLNDFLFN